MIKKFIATVLSMLSITTAYSATPTETAESLTQRIIPSLADKFVFKQIKSPVDTFVISTSNGKVLIEGNSANSMAVGLNNYLRRYLGTNVSWYAAEPIQVPEKIVLPDSPFGAKAAVDTRFFLNYCTFGYTMPYWQWEDWERFIDWMALNGVTLPLAMTGAEQSWYQTWRSFGLTDEEIRNSFTGPAHLPWHWMNNIDSFQGPLSLEWLRNQEELQKRILARERELGMTPVLPAFAGHVPEAVSKHFPEAKISEVSQWGEFPIENRCYFLDPSDPLYAEVQKRFIETQSKLYGTDHIYGIDPFNEVDSPDWSEKFLKDASNGIFSTLRAADPKAKWLMMTWNFYYDRKHWTKPRIQAFLEGVEGDNIILLDYFCDNIEIWRRSDKYFGKPYVWCYLGNFGGNTMLAGDMKDISTKISKTAAEGGKNLIGLGGTLEGFDCNPVMHEFVLAKAWDPDMTHNEWASIWANSRGGMKSDKVNDAWQVLADSVYLTHAYSGHACLTNARPAFGKPSTHYTKPIYNYSDSNLLKALDLLLAAENVEHNAAYQFDVMNITRQAMGNEFNHTRDRFTQAYRDGDLKKAKSEAKRMIDIINDLDALMATNTNFSLAQWIKAARNCATTPEDADNYEKNVRTLLTIWGYPDKHLNDYANRQWSGLLKNYYGKRWEIFTNAALAAMESGKEFNEEETVNAIKTWEGEWTDRKDGLTPISTQNPLEIARKLRAKYF